MVKSNFFLSCGLNFYKKEEPSPKVLDTFSFTSLHHIDSGLLLCGHWQKGIGLP